MVRLTWIVNTRFMYLGKTIYGRDAAIVQLAETYGLAPRSAIMSRC